MVSSVYKEEGCCLVVPAVWLCCCAPRTAHGGGEQGRAVHLTAATKMRSSTRVPKLFGDLLLGPTFQRSHHLPTAPSCVPRLYHRALGDFSKYSRNNHSVLSRPNPSTSERLRPSGGSAQTEGKPVHGGRMQTGQGRGKVCSSS